MNSSRFFLGAAILGAGLALKFGGPLIPVTLGVLAVGCYNLWSSRKPQPRSK